jgi:large subunit ribosomal protein L4
VTQATQERTDRTVDVRTPAGTTSGSVTLPGELFDASANVSLMHQVVVAQLAAARQGTHATKTRGQVSGGGAKPYRQKGTGRARQGSNRAPQFEGGGVVHGPQPRDYTQRTPKKMKAAALRGALSDRARDDRVHVVSTFVDGETPKTKAALATLEAVTTAKKVLVVLDHDDSLNWVSLRNEPRVHLIEAGQLNTYDVLNADEVIFTEAALAEFVARPAKAGVAKPDLRTPDIPGAFPSVQPDHGTTDAGTANEASANEAPAKKATAKKTLATKVAAKKAPAKKAATKAAAKTTAAKKAPATKAAEAPATKAATKTVATKSAAKKAPATKAAAADETTEENA